jgi:mRNA interferase RelE/StbE
VEKKEVWEVILTRPAEKAYDRSSKTIKIRLGRCFAGLEKDPIYNSNAKPLVGKLKGLYRYRVGDLQVIYRPIKESKSVEIIAILPRGKAY